MPSVTINREVAVHFWPVERNAPNMTCSSASSMSASSRTIAAFLPPISACTGTPRRGGGRRDAPSDAGGSGEGDGVHAFVVDQAVAEVRTADEQVEDTGGQTRAGERVREPHRQQRHRAGRLPHHGVAVDQGRGDLPCRDRDREVERGDDADDPDRFARHQDLLAGPRRGEDLSGLAVAFVAVVAQDLGGATHFADAFGLRLAFLGGQLETPRGWRCAPPRRPRPSARHRADGSAWQPTPPGRRRRRPPPPRVRQVSADRPSATTRRGSAGLMLCNGAPLPGSHWPATRLCSCTGAVMVISISNSAGLPEGGLAGQGACRSTTGASRRCPRRSAPIPSCWHGAAANTPT